MPLSRARALAWEGLENHAALYENAASRLVAHSDAALDAFDSVHPPSWDGSAARLARERFIEQRAAGRASATGFEAAAEAMRQVARMMRTQQSTAMSAVGAAIADGFDVSDSWVVSARQGASLPEERALILARHHEQVSNAANAFHGALARSITVLREAVPQQRSVEGRSGEGERAPEPPADASAKQNREYWDSLTEQQRAWVLEKHPEWIGDLDGVPSGARHEANIARIDSERERLDNQREELTEELEDNMFGGAFTNADAELWYTERKLQDLDTIENMLDDYPEGRLMLLDMSSGERGMAAFAIGDPDSADHVSVTTPGFTTTISGSFESMVKETASLQREAERQLFNNGRGEETVASIAWLGYEPPQKDGPGWADAPAGFADVAQSDHAEEGAARLASFYDGIAVASEQDDPHITALGHSYGSYTTGLALQDPGPGQPVDDAVFYGSPGVNASDEKDLGLDEGHAYVMEAEGVWSFLGGDGDPVGDLGNVGSFGPDPAEAAFEQLSTDALVTPDGIEREGSTGHSEYSRLGSNGELRTSGYNMAVIVGGLQDQVVRG
ncbi:alpha/beta hydrolase [Lolliginicoccus suaedae]|uniref:alpha/beta hydrolase n=1 Tax=Lolliginicoccus suaedae TaxID=2605429 RepID=UPI001F3F0AC1|nr:alpha/beta hydrolase [Lolliginicoccus suaedae]